MIMSNSFFFSVIVVPRLEITWVFFSYRSYFATTHVLIMNVLICSFFFIKHFQAPTVAPSAKAALEAAPATTNLTQDL